MNEGFPQEEINSQQPPDQGQEQLDQSLAGPQLGEQIESDGSTDTAVTTAVEAPQNSESSQSESVNDSEPKHLATINHTDDKSNLVTDESKAWDMAHASDEENTKAAAKRRSSQLLQERFDRAKNGEDLYSEESLAAEDELKNLGAVQHYDIVETELEADRGWKESEVARQYSRSAEKHQKIADLQDKWAGALHDHPVSEAFTERFSGVDFSPTGLANVEMEQDKDLDYIEVIEHNAALLTAKQIMTGRVDVGDNFSVQYDVIQRGDREQYKAWQELIDNPDTTLGQIRETFLNAFAQNVIAPIKGRVSAVSAMLEDVSSGRASQ